LNETNLVTLVVGAVTISILHALLPSHWLAFVLVGSAQGWRGSKIMRIAFLAGSGHVLMTILLGLTAALLAQKIMSSLGHFGTYISSGILIVLGFVYILLGVARKSNHHTRPFEKPSDKITALSLFLMLTFSPCEAMIPVFFAAGTLGWSTLVTLSLVTALGTIGSMILLIYLTMMGYKKLHFLSIEKNEKVVIGMIILALGIFAALYG